jgi:tRNA(adenine34) deaminase
MQQALDLAKKGALIGEIPVASIIINSKTKEIIASSHNLVESMKNVTSHSEIIVIKDTCLALGTKYLDGFEIYVTLEPCLMCYTALCYARISKIYFAAFDNKKESKSIPSSLYKPEIYGGIMEAESQKILSDFFGNLRNINDS